MEEVLEEMGLKMKTCMRVRKITTKDGIMSLHASKDTIWVFYRNWTSFDFFCCPSPKNEPDFVIKRNWKCVFSEYKMQENDSYSAFYC